MEEIRVYNTMTREKSVFVPVVPGEVKIYVCGVTPYNHPHIGNARPAVTWDVIRRYLQFIGYKVTLIQNFTDVDDKIINKANAEGSTWKVISDRYIEWYFKVIDALGVRRVDKYPRVSDHMDDIIDMVKTLIEKGHAYVLGGDVYYDISTFPNYGKLSGRKIEDMLAGARVEVNDEKRNPGDFAVWKGAKPGEPAWDSPWGPGRPGWHIECSAMSRHYLGDTFDFHGGGSDLIFPHHENEIAQSEGATGKPFVHYWMHNGFITINSEKMSKSLNNFFLVKDVLEKYSGEALRFFLLSMHYRSPLDFSDERLEEAETNMARLSDVVARVRELAEKEGTEKSAESAALQAAAEKECVFPAAPKILQKILRWHRQNLSMVLQMTPCTSKNILRIRAILSSRFWQTNTETLFLLGSVTVLFSAAIRRWWRNLHPQHWMTNSVPRWGKLLFVQRRQQNMRAPEPSNFY